MSTATRTEIEFEHGGKSYTLWRRGDNLYLRLTRNGRAMWKSTKSSLKAPAVIKAKKILSNLEKNDWVPEQPSPATKGTPTIGEILQRWRKAGVKLMMSPRTAKNYANALEKILVDVTGKDRASVANLSSVILTEDLIRNYIAKGRELGRPDHSIQSTITQARCVLQEGYSDIYTGLLLPDLSGFRARKKFRPCPDTTFKDFGREVVIAMKAAAEALWEARKPVWIPYALMSELGLRNAEVARAKWSDFSVRPMYDTTGQLHNVRMFRVVAGYDEAIEAELEVSDALWDKLVVYQTEGAEYVVPAKHQTERLAICEREINRFVEQYIPDRPKKSYELRKWAGSIVATKHGIYAAQGFLRHRSVTTTESNYASNLSIKKTAKGTDRDEIYGITNLPTPNPLPEPVIY